jgi:hypothetical protein
MKFNSPKGAFIDEARARGFDTPSYYNAVNVEKFKMGRTGDCKIFKPIKEVPQKLVKNNGVSPHTYKLENKHLGLSQFENVKAFKFSKGKKLTFTEIEVLKKKSQPGVGKYDISKAFERVLTLGLSRGYR